MSLKSGMRHRAVSINHVRRGFNANRVILLRVLNAHEFMAAAVRQSAFDEETYKRMYFTQVIEDWDHLAGFVKRYRRLKNKNTHYQEVQKFVVRWKKNPLKAENDK